MNIVIAGDGEVGFHLAEMLSKEDHNITVVDPHQELLKLLEAHTDILTLAGDPTSIKVLQNANVDTADLFIAVVHDEQPNILACILAKKIGAKRTIARINDAEYLRQENKVFFQSLGVDQMVSPELIAAKEIYNLLKQTATEVFSFEDNRLQLFQIRLSKESKVLNKTLDEIAKAYVKLDFRAVAIARNGQTIIPTGRDQFLENDLAYVVSLPSGSAELFRLGGKEHVDVKNVMIVGAGRIGQKTALQLEKTAQVKILDNDRERCQEVSQLFDKALVINGDATDIDLLEDERLERMDAFVAVTDHTETNILTCLHAKRSGVKKTVALVENVDYIGLSQSVGLDAIVNKKLITASYIARFTIEANVVASKVMSGIDAEVFEFIVQANSEVTQKPIYQLDFPDGAIIAGIIRDNQGYIALGHFRIVANDRVVVFALPRAIKQVARFFK
ncbi:MAG: Trk system potassium transporter TrkA [Bacteroidales bacterium]|jgi:trk system potassium uptake protein TrkA|nr:Trk system potassium transporter TrkA [Bacteroidales bacterium]